MNKIQIITEQGDANFLQCTNKFFLSINETKFVLYIEKDDLHLVNTKKMQEDLQEDNPFKKGYQACFNIKGLENKREFFEGVKSHLESYELEKEEELKCLQH